MISLTTALYIAACVFASSINAVISPIISMFVVVINVFFYFIGKTFESEQRPLEDVLLNVHSNIKDA